MLYLSMEKISPQLLKKYVEGRASEEECFLVEQWLEKEDNLFDDTNSDLKLDQVKMADTSIPTAIWHNFIRRTEEGLRQIKLWWWGTRIVLPLLLVVCAGGLYLQLGDHHVIIAEQQLLTLEVPKGKSVNVKLSDHTEIWLAGRSKLVYPKEFGANDRRLSLEYGHAFLQVAKDADRPFYLQSDGTQIRVLGTAFDISNRLGQHTVSVTLKEGSVEFSDQKGLLQRMQPGDRLRYNKVSNKLEDFEQVDVPNIGQWTAGKLYFSQTQLGDALSQLEDRYQISFKIKDSSLLNLPVTGKFENMPLARVLFLLGESTGLTFKQQEKNILVDR